MMYNIKVYLLLLVCCKAYLSQKAFECPYADILVPAGCICFRNSERLVCEENCKQFPNITGIRFKSVQILNTKITQLGFDDITNLQTDEIYIENNANLAEITPSIFLKGAHTVVISKNEILHSTKLVEGISTLNTSNTLKKLRIRESNLKSISNEAFKGLTNLEYILFEKNDLSLINPDLFNNLPNLKEINLEHNNIKIDNNSFALSKDIKTISINLNNNNINTDDLEKFKVPSNDTKLTLYLENNLITSFRSNPFKDLVENKKNIIYLNGNKINCIWGEIEWIFGTSSEIFSTNILNVNCDNYDGMDIFKMTRDQFTDRPTPSTTQLTSINTGTTKTSEPSNPTKPSDRSEPATTEPSTPIKPIDRSEPTTEASIPTKSINRTEPSTPIKPIDRSEPTTEPSIPIKPINRTEPTLTL